MTESGITRCCMYVIGICDDAKNTCASLEEMVLQYPEHGVLIHSKFGRKGNHEHSKNRIEKSLLF